MVSMQTAERVAPQTPGEPYRFTVDEYLRMAEQGTLDPDVRTELLDGVIVVMSPQNAPHIWTLSAIVEQLILGLAGHRAWQVISQIPLRIPDRDVPEPDVAIVPRLTPGSVPLGPEALLAVEVSDTTLAEDLGRKRRLYASAGVPNYWVADVSAKQVHRFADPVEGDYATHELLTAPAALVVPGSENEQSVPVAAFFS